MTERLDGDWTAANECWCCCCCWCWIAVLTFRCVDARMVRLSRSLSVRNFRNRSSTLAFMRSSFGASMLFRMLMRPAVSSERRASTLLLTPLEYKLVRLTCFTTGLVGSSVQSRPFESTFLLCSFRLLRRNEASNARERERE